MEDEETDLSVNFHQVASADAAEFLRVDRINPKGILMGNLVEKLGVARASVDEVGQPENRQQGVDLAPSFFRPFDDWRVAWIEVFTTLSDGSRLRGAMDVAAIVLGQSELWPLPVDHGFRK